MLDQGEDEYRRREGAVDGVVDSVDVVAVVAVVEHAVYLRDETESWIQRESKHDADRRGRRREKGRERQPSRHRYRVKTPTVSQNEATFLRRKRSRKPRARC